MISRILPGLFLSVFSFFAIAGLGPVFKERSGRDLQVRNMQLVEDGVLKASHGFLLDEQGHVICQVDITNASKEDQVSLVPGFVTVASASSHQAYAANIPVCSSLEKQEMVYLASRSRSSLDNQYVAAYIVAGFLLVAGYGFCRAYNEIENVAETEDQLKVPKRLVATGAFASGTVSLADTMRHTHTPIKSKSLLSKTAGKSFLRGLGFFGGGWLICEGIAYLLKNS